MNPIFLLKELGLLKGAQTVLDVGARDGVISARFAEIEMSVDAIDIHEPKSSVEGVNFQTISVEDFLLQNDKMYDIVVARHVLHHLARPKEIIQSLNNIAGIFFFTCFGPKDDWEGKVSTLAHDEVLSMFHSGSVKHHSEAFQYGKTYAGDTKYWHINTFVIDNRL
jgi:SAM-dependent methyltransferase